MAGRRVCVVIFKKVVSVDTLQPFFYSAKTELIPEELCQRGSRSTITKINDKVTANLGFEQKLWLAADKLRGNMDAAEHKHVILGLVFLKYISDSFETLRAWLVKETADPKSSYHVSYDKIGRRCWRIGMNIDKRTYSGCPNQHAGKCCSTTPRSPPLERPLMMRGM